MTPTPTPTPTIIATDAPPTPGAIGEAGRGRSAAGRALAALCVTACGVWAFMPLGTGPVEVPEPAEVPLAAHGRDQDHLDLAVFNAPLWVAPPPPATKVAETVPPPPAPPPLSWQLLAILRDGGNYKALVYDPDADKLLVLGEGDRSGPCSVARVTPGSMDVRDGAGVRTLALRKDGGGS